MAERVILIQSVESSTIEGPGYMWPGRAFVGWWVNWLCFAVGAEVFVSDGGKGIGLFLGPVCILVGWIDRGKKDQPHD